MVTTARRWNGTEWVEATVRRWDGTEWVTVHDPDPPGLPATYLLDSYPDEAALLADGWDFTAQPGNRDTRTTGAPGGAISYQPLTVTASSQGDIWDAVPGSSKYGVLRDLPTGWASVRVRMSNNHVLLGRAWHGGGPMIYQDDGHWIWLAKSYSNNAASSSRNTGAGGVDLATTGLATDTNYWLRIDRAGDTYTLYASPDGTTWDQVGDPITQVINQQRLHLFTTGVGDTGTPPTTFTYHEVQIL